MDIKELATRSKAIRERYHEFEINQDGQPLNVEQDALSFLTDAGLVGRKVMDQTGSWPDSNEDVSLDYKIAESIWWLASIADNQNINLEEALDDFLTEREQHLK